MELSVNKADVQQRVWKSSESDYCVPFTVSACLDKRIGYKTQLIICVTLQTPDKMLLLWATQSVKEKQNRILHFEIKKKKQLVSSSAEHKAVPRNAADH